MTEKKQKNKFISWGAGAIGQLDDDKAVDIKIDFISFHPKIGIFELPEVRIDDVDINLPTDKVLQAVGSFAAEILKQVPFVSKIPFAKSALEVLSGE